MQGLTYGCHILNGEAVGHVRLNDLNIFLGLNVKEREGGCSFWGGPAAQAGVRCQV